MNGSNSNTAGENVATVEAIPKTASDSIPDPTAVEMARRLKVTFQNQKDSDIWSEQTEPTNKALIWWPVDPTTGVRIGQPRTYNSATSQWEALGGTSAVIYAPRKFRKGQQFLAAAASQSSTITFSGMGSADFHISIYFTTENVSGVFQAASANMNNFGWEILAQLDGSFTAQFFNVPTGGLTMHWRADDNADDVPA